VPLFPESRLLGDTLVFSLEAPNTESAETLLFERLTPKKPGA
jgi:hypothetical protein